MKTDSTKSELKRLKSLVGSFLKEIECVPMRAVDCDQDKVEELMAQLAEAAKET